MNLRPDDLTLLADTAITAARSAAASDMCGDPLDLNRVDSTYMNHRGVCYATDADLAKQLFKLKDHPA